MLNFEWNPRKAKKNTKLHKVSFEEASSVFKDTFSILYIQMKKTDL